MKAGANRQDVVKIIAMFGEGKKAKEIATSLGIKQDVIIAFKPKVKAVAK